MSNHFLKISAVMGVVALSGMVIAQSATKAKPKTRPAKTSKASASAVVRQSGIENSLIDPANFDHQALSAMIFDLTNVERRRAGLQPVVVNGPLSQAATNHSRDMAARQYFNHKSKGLFNRTDPRARAQAIGYNPGMIAENIAMIPTYNSTRIQAIPGSTGRVVDADYNSYSRLALYAMQEWMKSPGHRKNILDRNLNSLGVGTAVGFKNNVPYIYLTQNFGG